MSSRSTIEPSFWQTYCCFRREPQSLCSRLKDSCPEDCVAVKSFTGIATSPNEIVSDPIERGAAMNPLSLFASFSLPWFEKARVRLCLCGGTSCHRAPIRCNRCSADAPRTLFLTAPWTRRFTEPLKACGAPIRARVRTYWDSGASQAFQRASDCSDLKKGERLRIQGTFGFPRLGWLLYFSSFFCS